MSEPATTTEYDYDMPVHPVCDLFPLMNGSDLECLEQDIMDNGLVNPIVVHNGQLVDGRNRLLACREARVEPRFVQWREIYTGKEELADWIWSVNAERRHLTVDQLLAVEVAFRAWVEREVAKLKQIEAGKRGAEGGRGNKKTLPMKSSEGFPKQKKAPDVRAKLAKQLNVSEHKVQQVLNVQKADPELLKQVVHGQVTLLDADKQVKEAAKPKSAEPLKSAHQPPAKVKKLNRKQVIEEGKKALRATMRPVLQAVDAALRRLDDDQRLTLVAIAREGAPTMEGWADLQKYGSTRGALLTAMEEWVQELYDNN